MGVKRGLKGVLFKSAGRRTLSLKFEFIISMLAPNNFFSATLRFCQGSHCFESGRKRQFANIAILMCFTHQCYQK